MWNLSANSYWQKASSDTNECDLTLCPLAETFENSIELMTFANSLNQNKVTHNVGPHLISKLVDTQIIYQKHLGRKIQIEFENKSLQFFLSGSVKTIWN